MLSCVFIIFRNITVDAHVEQAFFEGVGQGGFSAAGKTCEPEKGASVSVWAVAVGLLDAALEGEDVGVFAYLDFIYFTMKDMKVMKG